MEIHKHDIAIVTHHAPCLFIPQAQRKALQAGPQREWFDLLKNRVVVVAFFQIVIGYARAEVVDVVKADIARNPLH